MNKNIQTQYDVFSSDFVRGTDIHNEISRRTYYSLLDFNMSQKKILDVGCGDGCDLLLYSQHGAQVWGIDSSKELIALAQTRIPEANLNVGLMEKLPYENNTFDVVLSKYAIQTSHNIPLVIKEMDRVLKLGGTLAYLTVHPLRQFLEKKKHPKDYFLQEIVESVFFGGTVKANEPTHTMNEYLNAEFLSKYRVTYFKEEGDFPSSEKVDGDTYPCFFVLKAEKIVQ
jgi:ubiquinone/menaquinone biosynthesis C-methylase UbiE